MQSFWLVYEELQQERSACAAREQATHSRLTQRQAERMLEEAAQKQERERQESERTGERTGWRSPAHP